MSEIGNFFKKKRIFTLKTANVIVGGVGFLRLSKNCLVAGGWVSTCILGFTCQYLSPPPHKDMNKNYKVRSQEKIPVKLIKYENIFKIPSKE